MSLLLDSAASRSDCRDTLGRLLDEELVALSGLERLLIAERDVLAKNESPEALEGVCSQRQVRMSELLRIQDERRGLLRATGHTVDTAGIESLLRVCDPQRTLPERWARCADLAARCRGLNDFNGALVASRMRRVEGMLEILTGRKRETPVYGRQGQQAWVAAGRLLAAEA
jgi:flagellar biosynthesis/type III secretory pathway chaperone